MGQYIAKQSADREVHLLMLPSYTETDVKYDVSQ